MNRSVVISFALIGEVILCEEDGFFDFVDLDQFDELLSLQFEVQFEVGVEDLDL